MSCLYWRRQSWFLCLQGTANQVDALFISFPLLHRHGNKNRSCHGLQRNRQYPTISAISTSPSHQDRQNDQNTKEEEEEQDPIDRLFVELHSLINSHAYKRDLAPGDHILDLVPSYTLIMREIILKTRFGQRFSSIAPVYSEFLPCAIPLDLSDTEGREKVLVSFV
jgi:hypothetical protein